LINQELEAFVLALTNASGGLRLAKPESWIKAFLMLTQYLSPLIKKEHKKNPRQALPEPSITDIKKYGCAGFA